jgi:hypothetical protein
MGTLKKLSLFAAAVFGLVALSVYAGSTGGDVSDRLLNPNTAPDYSQRLKGIVVPAGGANSNLVQVRIPKGNIMLLRSKIVGAASSGIPFEVGSSNANTTANSATNQNGGIVNFYNGTPVTVFVLTNDPNPLAILPSGLSANTLYYARSNDQFSVVLYDTQAHAVAGGATGQKALTTTGTNWWVYPGALNSVTTTEGMYKCINNVFATVGTPATNVYRDETALNCAAVIDGTTNLVDITGSADAVIPTVFRVDYEYWLYSYNE